MDQHPQGLAIVGLTDAEKLPRDKQTTDAVIHEVAFGLWWKVGSAGLSTSEDLETTVVGQRLDDVRGQDGQSLAAGRCGFLNEGCSGFGR